MIDAPETPVRVIYAKLTSTRAYDVVAHTPNIDLTSARTLAERLLPGNPPIDAEVREEIAHLRPPEGGHIVLRFAPYEWADGNRGDVFLTDILWLSDTDFRRARSNPFALVQRTDQIFEVLEELSIPAIPADNAGPEMQRIAELAAARPTAKKIAAHAMAAQLLIMAAPHERREAMELLVLLLPPRIREMLTFQTQAFRVPSQLPLVTLVDRIHSNLRSGAWKILPDVHVPVPDALASQLLGLADTPERLALLHKLFDDGHGVPDSLHAGILRLTALSGLAGAIAGGDARAILEELAGLPADDSGTRAAGLSYLIGMTAPLAMRDAVIAVVRAGTCPAARVAALLTQFFELPESAPVFGPLCDIVNDSTSRELRTALAAHALRASDLSRLARLVATEPRFIVGGLPDEATRDGSAAQRFAHALKAAFGSRPDLECVAALLAVAVSVRSELDGPEAETAIQRLCLEAAKEAMYQTPANVDAVRALISLQKAAIEYRATYLDSGWLPNLYGPELLSSGTADLLDTPLPRNFGSVAACTLLSRAHEANARGDQDECEEAMRLAGPLIEESGGDLVGKYLQHRGLRVRDLAVLPGGEAVARALGMDIRRASAEHALVAAVQALRVEPTRGVAELATAVYRARCAGMRLKHGDEVLEGIRKAWRGTFPEAASSHHTNAGFRARQSGPSGTSEAAEIALEILALVVHPEALPELEDAFLHPISGARLRRLDRAISICRAAERGDCYDGYARAIEADRFQLEPDELERLGSALGTGGLRRRLIRAFSGVLEGEDG